MAIQLGSAYGKVELDASGVQHGVSTATTSLMNLSSVGLQVAGVLKSVGNAMTIGLTLPILALGTASVKAASDLEETQNKVSVVFGDMSESVLKWAQDSATAFGMSKQQALEAAGTFGNLFTSMGLGKDKAAEMSTGLVELAADLASFNNLDPNVVLEKLRSGLVGEVEPLRTLNINLTMTAVKAKAVQMGLADANGEVSQAALLQARYALILEQTSNAQGDFARTSDGLANQTRILKAEFADAMATLGKNLLPIVLDGVKAINKMLEAFNNMPPFVQKGILILLGFLALMGPLISFSGSVIGVVSSLAGFIGTLSSLGISLGSIAAAAGAAGTAIVGLSASALTVILPLLLIIATIALVYLAFKNNFMGITTTAKQLWFIVKWGFAQMWADLKSGTAEALENLRGAWDAWVEQNKAKFAGWAGWIQTAWQNVLNFFARARDYIVQIFQRVDWSQVGKFVIIGIVNGLLGGIPALIAAGIKAASELMKAFDSKLAIHSPSGEFEKRGKYSWLGYLRGWGQNDPNAMAQAMANPILNQSSLSQQFNNFHFASGLTIRQAREMMEENNDRIFGRLAERLAGV
jgi:hypothetical protein